MEIKGHTILITGGTSGIGKMLAEVLNPYNQVIITGRSADRLREARSAGLKAISCDLRQQKDLESLVLQLEQEYPDLDVLINNAGIQNNYDWINELNAHLKIQRELDTNLTGTIQLTQLLLPLLSTKSSTILNVTSALGAVPKSDGLVYSASKAGLRNFTRGLRKVLKGYPIRVIEVVPPVTETNMTAGRSERKMQVDALVRIILRQWKKRKLLIAPAKIRIFLAIDRFFPAFADWIIS